MTRQITVGSDDVTEDGATYAQSDTTIWVGSGGDVNGSYTGLRLSVLTGSRGTASGTALSDKGTNLIGPQNGGLAA